MTYYDDLVNDKLRVDAFTKVIKQETKNVTFDLGTGSGILAEAASKYASRVYAIESNPLIVNKTRKKLENYSNIIFLEKDATKVELPEKADTIICEMLDTALIDEQQVPVINHIQQYAKKDTTFIPKAVYSTIQLINTKIAYITYYEDEHPKITEASDEKRYDYIEFNKKINPEVNKEIKIKSNKKTTINAIKLTTYTIINDQTILAPTPMLNPPILIPIEDAEVEYDEEITINLKYKMGGGINSIQTTLKRNN